MFTFLSRHLFKSVHLVHTTPVPPCPIFYNKRGMPLLPRTSEILSPKSCSLKFTSPQSPVLPEPVSNTRVLKQEVKELPNTVKATRKYLRTSIKKVWMMTKVLKGKHVEDAISLLENTRKKPAEWIKNIIKAGVRSAVNIKGMQEDRLYVKYFVMGKNKGIKGIRYHAKGKTGHMLRPKTQITVVLEEKTVEDFYKVIMTGKFSPTIASIIRFMMLSQNSSYGDIVKYQNYLTAKGRQQQKLMFKRKVQLYLEEQEKLGIKLDRDYAKELLLKEESKPFVEQYWNTKKTEIDSKLAERLEVFQTNQKSR